VAASPGRPRCGDRPDGNPFPEISGFPSREKGGQAMIKVMIKRRAPADKQKELLDLITRLRSEASKQPGYISGETLRGSDRPEEFLVISIWDDDLFWKKWIATDERKAIQGEIDKLIGTPTEYEIYRFPRKVSVE
jgi:heme-degrading monooxygenase HmoA